MVNFVKNYIESLILLRNASLDILKIILAIMVIGLHTEFLSDSSALASYLAVNGIFRIAVPVFLIINGFYFYSILAEKNQSLWFRRALILYLIWMGIYSYFWLRVPEWNFSTLGEVVVLFFIGYWHLWYISGMLGAAVLVLMLNIYPKIMIAIAAIAFLIGVAIQYAGNYHILAGTEYDAAFNFHPAHRNAVFFSFPFFCIGYLINKYSIQNLVSLRTTLVGVFLGGMLLISESYLNFIQPSRDGEFDNYVSLALVCPAVFILTLKLFIEGHGKFLSDYAAAMYFVHVFVIHLIFVFVDISGSLLTFVVIFFSTLASLFLVKVNAKLKVIL